MILKNTNTKQKKINTKKKKNSWAESRTWTICTEGQLLDHCAKLPRITSCCEICHYTKWLVNPLYGQSRFKCLGVPWTEVKPGFWGPRSSGLVSLNRAVPSIEETNSKMGQGRVGYISPLVGRHWRESQTGIWSFSRKLGFQIKCS